MGIPLLILSFFSLSILYSICIVISSIRYTQNSLNNRLCKFPDFSLDSRISKVFYIFLFAICVVRASSFAAATGLYADSYEKNKEEFLKLEIMDLNLKNFTNMTTNELLLRDKEFMGIDKSPKLLVLLLISPDFLVIFAYLILFWQLMSIYYDGHANLFKSVFAGQGKYMITVIGFILLISSVTLIALYMNSIISA